VRLFPLRPRSNEAAAEQRRKGGGKRGHEGGSSVQTGGPTTTHPSKSRRNTTIINWKAKTFSMGATFKAGALLLLGALGHAMAVHPATIIQIGDRLLDTEMYVLQQPSTLLLHDQHSANVLQGIDGDQHGGL
jgi:hypothetical protein